MMIIYLISDVVKNNMPRLAVKIKTPDLAAYSLVNLTSRDTISLIIATNYRNIVSLIRLIAPNFITYHRSHLERKVLWLHDVCNCVISPIRQTYGHENP